MFTATTKILGKAQRGHYAVAHFNINNLEMVQAIVNAAMKLKSQVILATSEGAIQYAGMDYLYALAKTASEQANIPIALHLDHGRDITIIQKAINIGYSSIMIDASPEDFENNIALTKKIVQLAHRKGISVEAELGTIGGAEDKVSSRKIRYTDPLQAQEFVERTGCDFLAVAIGTSHGAYKFQGEAQLQLDRLREIRKKVRIPLVLHGASGVPEKMVQEAQHYGADLTGVEGIPEAQVKAAIKEGITKVNTDTDLRLAFDAAVRKAIMTKPKDFDPRHILAPAREAMQKVAEQRIWVCGSVGKAR